MNKDSDSRFVKNVDAKATRKLKALRKPGRSVWMGLGTMGIVGWSVGTLTMVAAHICESTVNRVANPSRRTGLTNSMDISPSRVHVSDRVRVPRR